MRQEGRQDHCRRQTPPKGFPKRQCALHCFCFTRLLYTLRMHRTHTQPHFCTQHIICLFPELFSAPKALQVVGGSCLVAMPGQHLKLVVWSSPNWHQGCIVWQSDYFQCGIGQWWTVWYTPKPWHNYHQTHPAEWFFCGWQWTRENEGEDGLHFPPLRPPRP